MTAFRPPTVKDFGPFSGAPGRRRIATMNVSVGRGELKGLDEVGRLSVRRSGWSCCFPTSSRHFIAQLSRLKISGPLRYRGGHGAAFKAVCTMAVHHPGAPWIFGARAGKGRMMGAGS